MSDVLYTGIEGISKEEGEMLKERGNGVGERKVRFIGRKGGRLRFIGEEMKKVDVLEQVRMIYIIKNDIISPYFLLNGKNTSH